MPDDLTTPENRTEDFLAAIAGLADTMPSASFTRLERYLAAIGTEISGKAPGDYGLGGVAKNISGSATTPTDLNDYFSCGFYCWGTANDEQPAHAPFKGGIVLAMKRTATGNAFQLAVRPASSDVAWRFLYNSVWSDWVYLNPYLSSDTEYATTERYNGNIVYAKRLPSKTLDATGTKTWTHGIANFNQIIRVEGAIWKAPLNGYPGVTGITCDTTEFSVTTSGAAALTGGTLACYPVLYYTKTAPGAKSDFDPGEKTNAIDDALEEMRV